MNLPLETERLHLRLFQESDIVPFQRYRNDPEVARYQAWDLPYTLEMAAAFVAAEASGAAGRTGGGATDQPGEWRQLALELKATAEQAVPGEMIGDCAYVYLKDDPRQAEIAFTLAREFQGQGYASEAVSRLVAALFEDPHLHRIRANVDPANTASARLCQRLGMRFEGRFVESLWLRGEWVSEDWYAILRSEWIGYTGSHKI